MQPYIYIFGKNIPLYGIFCTIGITIAVIIALLIAKKQGYEFFDFILIAIITLVSAFIGAKALFIIVSFDTVISIFQNYSFLEAITILTQGGYVFYGGLIGGVVGLYITLRIKKQNFIDYASIYAMVLTIGHAFGRVGCFFSGCCYGKEYDGFLSFKYTSAIDASTPIGVKLLPIQLIEACVLLLLFVVLTVIYFKCSNHRHLVIVVYAITYPTLRFILEFFRGDIERGVVGGLSTSQWISIGIIIITIAISIYGFFKNKKTNYNHLEQNNN